MDKVKLLMDKYGLPEGLAYEVERQFQIADLFEVPASTQPPKKDNELVVDIVRNAVWQKKITLVGDQSDKVRIKHHADGTPYKSIAVGGPKFIEFLPQITQVQFLINNERYSIDDMNVIEYLRKCLVKYEGNFMPKRKASRPKKPSKKVLAELAVKLMNHSNAEFPYGKRVFAGEIFAIFLPEWRKYDNEMLQDSISNLMK
jgi:hypothetical protein